MKKLFVALGLASLLALTASQPLETAQAATCPATDPCVTLVGSDIVVVILGQEVARVPAPVKTVEVRVPVPGPVRTIIQPSPVPGPVRTILIPGPVRTVPGPTRTVIVTQTPSVGPTGQVPSPSATLTPRPAPTPSVVTTPGKTITVTRTKAAGISLGLLLLGLLLGVLSVYAASYFSRKKAQKEELAHLIELKQDLIE